MQVHKTLDRHFYAQESMNWTLKITR